MTRPADTTRQARSIQLNILRRMPGPARVSMALEMSESVREVTRAGIRHRHPEWSEEQVHDELLVVLLGPNLGDRVRRARLVPA